MWSRIHIRNKNMLENVLVSINHADIYEAIIFVTSNYMQAKFPHQQYLYAGQVYSLTVPILLQVYLSAVTMPRGYLSSITMSAGILVPVVICRVRLAECNCEQ